jgi:hypothetical protein
LTAENLTHNILNIKEKLMKELIIKLMDLKEKERVIKEERAVLEGEIYTMIESQFNDDKTVTVYADEYKLSVKPNFAVSVDQEEAAKFPNSFKVKYELSYSQYKKAEGELDEIVTIKQNKPTFSVEIK